MPEPLGELVQINLLNNAAHAKDLVTRCSTTGIVIFINGRAPIMGYSKQQNTIKASTFGLKFVKLCIATEMNEGVLYKL